MVDLQITNMHIHIQNLSVHEGHQPPVKNLALAIWKACLGSASVHTQVFRIIASCDISAFPLKNRQVLSEHIYFC